MTARVMALTFDVENDCSLPSFKGIKIGLPRILALLDQFRVPATFFVTGDVAKRFPNVIIQLSGKHEIACHGYYHESFQKMDSTKESLIKSAKKLIEETIGQEIIGFRAPYLRTCPELFKSLNKLRFKYDSSLAWFKVSHWTLKSPVTEYRLMFPNILFRFPLLNKLFQIGSFINKVPVLYFHPWEAIDVRNLFITRPHYFWNLFSRPDRWLNSGSPFITFLSKFIQINLEHGFRFHTLRHLFQNSF